MAGQHAELLGLDLEDVRHVGAQAEHPLRRRVQREAPGLAIILRERRARLHRVHHHAAVDELEGRDMRGLGESGRHLLAVAEMIVERDVARRLLVDERRARSRRLLGAHHRGQRIDIDLDRLGGVLGRERGLGDDAGDGIADEAHLVARQRRPRRLLHRRAVPVLERHDAFERAVLGEIGAGIDREHARHRARDRGVNALDHAMRDAAADHHRIGLAGELDVVGVAALAAHERGVLAARHRLADAELHHGEIVRVVLQIHETRPGSMISPASRAAAGAGSTNSRVSRRDRHRADGADLHLR